MKRRSEEATSRPPQLPRRLRPSAVARRGTRHSMRLRIAVTYSRCSRGGRGRGSVPFRTSTRMVCQRPSFFPRRRIAEVVLLAQFVGDARGRRVEIARVADDLGAPAAVVGHVAQRGDVDAIVAGDAAASCRCAAERSAAAARPPLPAPATGKRKRDRQRGGCAAARLRAHRRRRPRRRCRSRRPALRSRESAACTSRMPVAARGVVAVGNHDQRLLAVLARAAPAAPPRRPRRTSPCRRSASIRPSARVRQLPIGRPALQQHRIVAEAIEEDLVLADRAARRGSDRARSAPPRSCRRPCCRSCRARCRG